VCRQHSRWRPRAPLGYDLRRKNVRHHLDKQAVVSLSGWDCCEPLGGNNRGARAKCPVELFSNSTDEAVAAHDSVLQTVIEQGNIETVVPVGFGIAFKNARTLKGVMRGTRRALRKALNDIEGCVELGVKLVDTAKGTADTDELRDRLESDLAPLSVGRTDDDLFSDRLVTNRSYLIEQDHRDAFDDAINAIDADYKNVLVKYTGPWAPYNFVDIRIGAEASR
jgi:hypothetical protein